MSVSLKRLSAARRGNEALGAPLSPAEREAMIAAAAAKLEELLDILLVDHRNDHNTRETPLRVARMLVEETLDGRFAPPPALTAFENARGFRQMIVVGPIAVRSLCAHHLMPIQGEAHVGILPAAEGRIIGLSKYDRVVAHFAARLQIQEELVQQIGEFLWDRTSPHGLAVRISAAHLCRTHRGVLADPRSRMTTTAWLGAFEQDPALKDEFLRECRELACR